MSYLAKRVLELAFLERQNRVWMMRAAFTLGYNGKMLRVLASRVLAGDY